MDKNNQKDRVVISLGGSLIFTDQGLDTEFLSEFNKFIRKKLADNNSYQFFIITGGGKVARQYRDVSKEVLGPMLTSEDLDWLGIHTTRLNAHLIRTIFRDLADPAIIKDYENLKEAKAPVVIGAGWKPGWSTDYDAVLLCEKYKINTVMNLSNIDRLYDKDPKQFPDAKPIDKITWKELRQFVDQEWRPGMNVPFDPIASKKAEKLGLKVALLKGNDLDNLDKYFKNNKFIGTIIT